MKFHFFSKRSERVESHGINVTMNFTRPFLLGPVFFRTALPCSGGYHLKRGGMPLHDAVGINCKRAQAQLLKLGAQMSSICANGCMLMIVCIRLDKTTPPWRKLWFIIIIIMCVIS